MKTIAILNLKGGTAKTVTAATMARCLANDYGKEVVLIDADQQGNLSQYFGVTDVGESEHGNTYELLTSWVISWKDFCTVTKDGLFLVPTDMGLALADIPDGRVHLTAVDEFRTMLSEDSVDFLIIDLPPSLGVPTQAALLAADEVIIPIRLDVFSTSGMAELRRQVDSMRTVNPRLRVAGVLGTQFQRTEEEKAIHKLLTEESGLPVYKTTIRMSPPVPRSIAARESILTFSPHCGASKDYRRFVIEYLEGSGIYG